MTAVDNFIQRCKRLQAPCERFLFPAILLLWPLVAVNQGVCLMDPTYSLGNYEFLTAADGYWFFATFLANLVGKLFAALPLGRTMLGMNVLCGLLISVTALSAYYVLQRMIPGWMVFLGELLAIAFCWCPSVILYNTLTYLLLTWVCLCLFLAVNSVEEGRANRYFLLAGICLGFNVTVRIANAAEAALILAVWFHSAVTHDSLARAAGKTLRCIVGAAIGFGAVVLVTMVVYGPTAYFSMIPELLGATSTTSDYTAAGMLSLILQAYGTSLRWFVILIPCTLAGYVLFCLPMLRRLGWVRRAIYVAGILVILRFYWGRGMFTTNYQDYPSMFQWGMMLVILMWITDVMGMAGLLPPKWVAELRSASGKRGEYVSTSAGRKVRFANGIADEQFLCCASLILILILPLGSNNYTYPVIGNMFLTAPVLIWMLRRYWQEMRGGMHFAWHAMAVMILVMALVQGGLFHMQFSFRDGTDGTDRSAMVEGNAVVAGMLTTPENAEALTALLAFLDDEGLMTDHELLTFGNIPGLHYVTGMAPAVDSTWVDLDSYTVERFQTALGGLIANQETPVIVIHEDDTEVNTTADKGELLAHFLSGMNYETVYNNCGYQVYTAEGR